MHRFRNRDARTIRKLVKAFAAHKVTLSSAAIVVVQAEGPLWTITDGITTYRVFQGCDQRNYVPALGVSTSAVLAREEVTATGVAVHAELLPAAS